LFTSEEVRLANADQYQKQRPETADPFYYQDPKDLPGLKD